MKKAILYLTAVVAALSLIPGCSSPKSKEVSSVRDDALGVEFAIEDGWDGDAKIKVPVLKVDKERIEEFCKGYGVKESSLPMTIPTNGKSVKSLLLSKVGSTDVPFLVILMEDGSVRTLRMDQFLSGKTPESTPLLGFDKVVDFRKSTRKVISGKDTLNYNYVVAIGKNGSNKEIPLSDGDVTIYRQDGGNLITLRLDPSWKIHYSVASLDGTLSSDKAEGLYIKETLNPEKVTYLLSDGRKGEFQMKWKGFVSEKDKNYAVNFEITPKEGLLLGAKEFGQSVIFSDTK